MNSININNYKITVELNLSSYEDLDLDELTKSVNFQLIWLKVNGWNFNNTKVKDIKVNTTKLLIPDVMELI